MGPKFTRLLWLVLAVQLLILYKISSNSAVKDSEREKDAQQSQTLRRSSSHAQAQAETSTTLKRYLQNPLPGVHMVYMYANGTDPGISGPRAQFGGPVSVTSRDRDNGELRYSFRSLEKYAPWFQGDIILLQGDDAPPYWLNTSHPRIRLVHHSDYFVDRTVLPTFSSDAIHVNIHRVPGLGDIMINWCDDFFLGAPVYPEDWVRDGKPVIYLESGYVRGGQTEYERTKARKGNKWLGKVYHTKAVIEREFPDHAASGKRLNFVKHAPFPMSLKVLREMAERYKAEYNQTYHNRFRTYDTVDVPTLHNMYCQLTDQCIADSQEMMDASKLFVLTKSDEENYVNILRYLTASPPKFFTFNDGWGAVTPSSVNFVFQELLPALFPTPSQFELRED